MRRLSKIQLIQCALEVEFAYSCDLEWQPTQHVHVLKAHRYETWRPVLLYHRLCKSEGPEYLCVSRPEYEAVCRRFRELAKCGHAPYTAPFASSMAFLELFRELPELEQSMMHALEQMPDFDIERPALIVPIEQTLHRSPHLVAPAGNRECEPALWLLGDAAVGLPVSKGCNLVYHMAAACKLADMLPEGRSKEYEAFVFHGWHGEAWRESKGRRLDARPPPCCFGRRLAGRFVG
jgi:hypothetical protein